MAIVVGLYSNSLGPDCAEQVTAVQEMLHLIPVSSTIGLHCTFAAPSSVPVA